MIPPATYIYKLTVFQWCHLLVLPSPNSTCLTSKTKIFKTIITKPKIYICYIDEIFIATPSYDKINKFNQTLEKNSVLNFTFELNINKISFFLMYLLTSPIMTKSIHLHIKSLPATIPPCLTTTVNVSKNIK